MLRELLPKEIEPVPSGFEVIGDIAHMNLTGKTLDYKNIIGQVVLDKNPILRAVVNKVG